MPRLRTFVAVPITDALRQQARRLISRLSVTSAKVRWVEPEVLHWTLQFLGDVEQDDTLEVCRAVAEAAGAIEPFEITAGGVGAFPSVQRPRTLWLGVADGEQAMVDLHDAVAAALQTLGYQDEARRFHPHLTIGRVRDRRGADDLAARLANDESFDAGEMLVDEIIVYSSELRPLGAIHTPLARSPLGGS